MPLQRDKGVNNPLLCKHGKAGKESTKIFLIFFVFYVSEGIKGVYNRNVANIRHN
jgi:hypothetical protein